jgi:hypothetical protein
MTEKMTKSPGFCCHRGNWHSYRDNFRLSENSNWPKKLKQTSHFVPILDLNLGKNCIFRVNLGPKIGILSHFEN